MKDVGTRLITERLGKDESPVTPDKYLIGYCAPLNVILHVHMHVLSKPITCSWPRSMAFLSSWLFKTVDEVIANLSS
ncbi:HIT-like protein [Gigaspora margarita]|uniref:HIT-like protein n=1 Tax=Gigaspora margarita TaxID=4874 RepID=A0A8H4A0G4_GIGMA|nr:HIT-like protein [Gigaspora margarita]